MKISNQDFKSLIDFIGDWLQLEAYDLSEKV